MAIVTQPLGSSEARGSVGGLTYNTWRGKHTVKTRSGPARIPTAPQLTELARAAAANTAWIALTDAQRDAWRHFATEHRDPHWTGHDKRLTGHNWFVRIRTHVDFLGNPQDADPPTELPIHLISAFTTHGQVPDLYVEWVRSPDDSNGENFLEVWTAGPHSPGRRMTLHDANRITFITTWDQIVVLDILVPGYYTVFARFVRGNGWPGPWYSSVTQVLP